MMVQTHEFRAGVTVQVPFPGSPDAERARVPLLDRLVARNELSLLGSAAPGVSLIPFAMSVVLMGPDDARNGVVGRIGMLLFLLSLVGAAVELVRQFWVLRHPYASPRWLNAVAAVIGRGMMTQVLEQMSAWYSHDPDYVIKRDAVVREVRTARLQRREAGKDAEGIRLADIAGVS